MNKALWIFGNAQADLQFMVATDAMDFVNAMDAQPWNLQERQQYLKTMFTMLNEYRQFSSRFNVHNLIRQVSALKRTKRNRARS